MSERRWVHSDEYFGWLEVIMPDSDDLRERVAMHPDQYKLIPEELFLRLHEAWKNLDAIQDEINRNSNV